VGSDNRSMLCLSLVALVLCFVDLALCSGFKSHMACICVSFVLFPHLSHDQIVQFELKLFCFAQDKRPFKSVCYMHIIILGLYQHAINVSLYVAYTLRELGIRLISQIKLVT
jgi:hypothetical protein